MNPNLKLHLGQQLSFSPQLVASIRLLQLAWPELEQEVVCALEQNPLLEAETAETPPASEAELSFAALVGEGLTPAMDAPQQVERTPVGGHDEIDIDDSFAASEAWSAASGERENDDGNPLCCVAAATAGLRATLEAELATEISDTDTQRAVLALLEAIDDAGYLRATRAELCAASGCDTATLRQALAMIRRLAPTGFAARDLRECLLLQLEEVRAGTPGKTLAEQLVMDHLLELGAVRHREILRVQLGASPERFKTALLLIRTLNPKPGLEYGGNDAPAIVPDVIVSGAPGAWKIELNPATLPRVRLNRLYEQALSSSQGRALKDQLVEARWLLRGLEMRHDTLLRTTQAIFERQSEFLTQGEMAMKPLTLREVAAAIEMHESTISRVTTSKYVATPRGVFELKHFFSVSLNAGDAESSGVAVRAMIRQLIDAENPAKPLCDGAISAILLRGGVRVARRTVAKYREGMRIASGAERKVEPALALAV